MFAFGATLSPGPAVPRALDCDRQELLGGSGPASGDDDGDRCGEGGEHLSTTEAPATAATGLGGCRLSECSEQRGEQRC